MTAEGFAELLQRFAEGQFPEGSADWYRARVAGIAAFTHTPIEDVLAMTEDEASQHTQAEVEARRKIIPHPSLIAEQRVRAAGPALFTDEPLGEILERLGVDVDVFANAARGSAALEGVFPNGSRIAYDFVSLAEAAQRLGCTERELRRRMRQSGKVALFHFCGALAGPKVQLSELEELRR